MICIRDFMNIMCRDTAESASLLSKQYDQPSYLPWSLTNHSMDSVDKLSLLSPMTDSPLAKKSHRKKEGRMNSRNRVKQNNSKRESGNKCSCKNE